jgi:hypothetical protein
MKTILAAFAALFMTATLAFAEQKCQLGAVEDIEKFASSNSLEAFELKPELIQQFNEFINKNLMAGNLPPTMLDKFVIINLKNGDWMVMYFKNGCIAPNSMATIPTELLSRVLDKAGLKKEDFLKFGVGA